MFEQNRKINLKRAKSKNILSSSFGIDTRKNQSNYLSSLNSCYRGFQPCWENLFLK